MIGALDYGSAVSAILFCGSRKLSTKIKKMFASAGVRSPKGTAKNQENDERVEPWDPKKDPNTSYTATPSCSQMGEIGIGISLRAARCLGRTGSR